VSVLAGMASHALRSAPGHVSAGNHAAARKALKHFSKAMRSDLKVSSRLVGKVLAQSLYMLNSHHIFRDVDWMGNEPSSSGAAHLAVIVQEGPRPTTEDIDKLKIVALGLQSWGSQSMPQRTSVAAAARALLAAAAGTAADTRSNRLQRALADITTATFSWERLQTPAPSSAFLHSEGIMHCE